MTFADAAAVPYARTDPPWCDCGSPADPDFGCVFAWRAARGARVFSFDRAGLRHAITWLRRRPLPAELTVAARRFRVVDLGHPLWERP